jgi:hypothetical protein
LCSPRSARLAPLAAPRFARSAKKFKGKSTLSHHVLRFHPAQFEVWSKGATLPKRWMCTQKFCHPDNGEIISCTFSTFKKSELDRHETRAHNIQHKEPVPLMCKFGCGYSTARTGLMKSHESACPGGEKRLFGGAEPQNKRPRTG